jgi:hypothetical protein
MASRRGPGPFALSPLQGGRRAAQHRTGRGLAVFVLAAVILGALALGALAWAL